VGYGLLSSQQFLSRFQSVFRSLAEMFFDVPVKDGGLAEMVVDFVWKGGGFGHSVTSQKKKA